MQQILPKSQGENVVKTPKQQILEFFQPLQLEVKFQDVAEGFFAEVESMAYPLQGSNAGEFNFETVSIYYGGEQGDYRFAISIILNKVTDASEVLRYSNDYNCKTYGWKAELDREEMIDPFFSFDYEFEFVQPDRIGDIMASAFDELCTMANSEYFYPLMRLQRKKQN